MQTFHLDGFGAVPSAREQAYAFYKMVPLADGFPGRRLATGEVAPHPIYGCYLIRDFLTVFQATKDRDALRRAIRMADITIARMASYRGALIFFYQDDGLLSAKRRFYSGLTQARYLTCFFDLFAASGIQKYEKVAAKILKSLIIPVSWGGVCRPFRDGVVIEEFPHEVPNFVLNGWTTAIVQVLEYAAKSRCAEAVEFGAKNMAALRHLLPLYDIPELRNTRYRLSGLATHRLVGSSAFHVVRGHTLIGSDEYEISPGRAAWKNSMFEDGKNKWRVETFLSRATYPIENSIRLILDLDQDSEITQFAGVMGYNGYTVRQNSWTEIAKHFVPAGVSTLVLSVPWDVVPLVGSPTNFSKKVREADGSHTQRNVYHYLHISNLDALYRLTGDASLLPWISKWFDYTKSWGELEIYCDPLIDHRPVGAFRISSHQRNPSEHFSSQP